MTDTTTKMTSLKVMAIMSSMVFASLASIAILTQHPPTIAAYAQQQSQTFTAKLSGSGYAVFAQQGQRVHQGIYY
jgi:multidrug resistance efflux pump